MEPEKRAGGNLCESGLSSVVKWGGVLGSLQVRNELLISSDKREGGGYSDVQTDPPAIQPTRVLVLGACALLAICYMPMYMPIIGACDL